MNGSGITKRGIFIGMEYPELRRLRDDAARTAETPRAHAGMPRYVDDVRVGNELEISKPQDPDCCEIGRVAVHHLGEPRYLILVFDDAEGLGARKGKAKKKKNKKNEKLRKNEWRFEYNDDLQWSRYTCTWVSFGDEDSDNFARTFGKIPPWMMSEVTRLSDVRRVHDVCARISSLPPHLQLGELEKMMKLGENDVDKTGWPWRNCLQY